MKRLFKTKKWLIMENQFVREKSRTLKFNSKIKLGVVTGR